MECGGTMRTRKGTVCTVDFGSPLTGAPTQYVTQRELLSQRTDSVDGDDPEGRFPDMEDTNENEGNEQRQG